MFRRTFSYCMIVYFMSFLHVYASVDDRPTGYEDYQVIDITLCDSDDVNTVHELERVGPDFQVWSEVVRIGTVQVRIAPRMKTQLENSGLQYNIVIKDLQKYLDSLYKGEKAKGFFDSLRTYNEHVKFMFTLTNTYPNLAEVFSLGQSVQGRELWALRITGTPGVKPAVLYHGAEHGNEQAPSSVVAYVAEYLLENYDIEPQVTMLVDNVEWFLLPIMNPDGYVNYDRYNANYVDLNRNWDGPGSGLDPSGGPYPFSEPETSNVREFLIVNDHARVHVDLHGYVPWIMWAWAHIPDHCADHDRFEAAGVEFRDRIYNAGGGYYDIGTIYDVAYYTSGCSTNYSYGVLDRWAFGIEVNDASMPTICEEFLDSMLYLGQWIRDFDCNGNGIDDSQDIASGTSTDHNSNGIPDECEIGWDVPGLTWYGVIILVIMISLVFSFRYRLEIRQVTEIMRDR